MVAATVSRWGNSFGIRIPAEVIREKNIHEGDTLELDLKKINTLPASLDEYLRQVKWDGKIEDCEEISTGSSVGEEIW